MFQSCTPHKEYNSNYRGIVIDNYDPDVRGKCKIFVPGVYPSDFQFQPERLPWAEPIMPLWGGNFQPKVPGHLNPETGYTTIAHEGAHVWVFFERGDWNYPKYWAASQAGDGWVSENNNQHTIRTDNVTIIVDEKPYLPAEPRGGDPWGGAIAVNKLKDNEVTGIGAVEAMSLLNPPLDAKRTAEAIQYDLITGIRTAALKPLDAVNGILKNITSPLTDSLGITNPYEQPGEPTLKLYPDARIEEEPDAWLVKVDFQSKEEADNFVEYYGIVFPELYGNNIFGYAYQVELDDEPNDTSTQRYDSFNKQCTDLSIANWQKIQQPTMVDIKIHMLSGIALNMMITGDVNQQIKGDVYQEQFGNKHVTLSGNMYYHHIGDYHHYHNGTHLYEHDGDFLEKTRGNKSHTISASRETYIGGSEELRIGSDYTINTGANKSENIGGGFFLSAKGTIDLKSSTYNLATGNESRTIKGGSNTQVDGDCITSVKGNFTTTVVGKTKFDMDSQALFRSTDEVAIVSRLNKVIVQAETQSVDIYSLISVNTYSTFTTINALARIDLLRGLPGIGPKYKVPFV